MIVIKIIVDLCGGKTPVIITLLRALCKHRGKEVPLYTALVSGVIVNV